MPTIREIDAANCQAIQAEIRDQLSAAWQFLEVAGGVLSAAASTQNSCPDKTKCVLLGILVEGLTLYRSVLALCEAGQASAAEIVSRTLFELHLAQLFILNPPPDQKFGLPPLPPHEDSTDFMAKVYFYASVLRIEHAAGLIGKNPKATGILAAGFDSDVKQITDEARKDLGAEWAERIIEKTTFAGAKVEEVATHYKLTADYDVFYRIGSIIVHASDALADMKPEERNGIKIIHLAFHSSPAAVANALGLSYRWLLKLLAGTSKFFAIATGDALMIQEIAATLDS